MAQWEYKHEWIKLPLQKGEGDDLTQAALKDINKFGADGWEVCTVLECAQY